MNNKNLSIMKKIISIFVLGLVILNFTQCTTNTNSDGSYVWKPKTGSYSNDSRAIDTLLMGSNWSNSAYDSIFNAIEADYNNKKVTGNQLITLYRKLMDGSAYYSFQKVDSLLRLSSVNEKELFTYSNMNSLLDKDYREMGDVNPELGNNAKIVDKSKDLIEQYKKVRDLCNSKFIQKVDQPPYKRYCMRTVEEHEKLIKNNKYWATHFCNNIQFKKSFPEFPDRREAAIKSYYANTVADFSTNVLTEKSLYSIEENIKFYESLVQYINIDLGKDSQPAKDATAAIVRYYEHEYKNNTEIDNDKKYKLGNDLLNTIRNLVSNDCGLAAFLINI